MTTHSSEYAVSSAPAIGGSSTFAALFRLAKPSIVGLTLAAALTGIYFASRGVIHDMGVIAWTLITLGMATAGACLINNIYDQDIDRLMRRTHKRGLVAGSVPLGLARMVTVLLIVPALILMALKVNLITAVLTASAIIGYSVIYTMLVKRRTPWANQFGGLAGALPPVIGYTAIAGMVDINAAILFIIMVVWQHPHALSIALKYRDEYAKAGVPVIPVVRGVAATQRRIVFYTLALIPTSTLPYLAGMAGAFYLATALAVSAIYFAMAVRTLRSEREYDIRLFVFSLIYLIVLFMAMVFDASHLSGLHV